MNRRSSSALTANPVLIGAVAVLVVVTAVFLSYNANKGLPFVPSKSYKVQVASGANVLPGADVKIGGQRVGFVEDLKPVQDSRGKVVAELAVKLDESSGAVPVDSVWRVRPRSPIGLKYVELTRGASTRILADGDTVPTTRTSFATELDQYQNIFDEETRAGVGKVVRESGNTFALRGIALNDTLSDAPRLLEHLEPVARSLTAPGTRLRELFRELGDGARVVAPEAEAFAHSFTAGADTFQAWSSDEDALAESIRESAPTLAVATPSLRAQRPLLVALRENAAAIERVADVLPAAAPPLTRALAGAPEPLRRAPALSGRLSDNVQALGVLSRDPATSATFVGIRRLGDILRPLTRHVGPYITVCNYFNYAFTHAGEHLTEPDPTGTAQRTLQNSASRNRDSGAPSIATPGAVRPQNGQATSSGVPIHLHGQSYGPAVSASGAADCEAGQRGYLKRLNTQTKDPSLNIVRDPHIPGNQGTTFTGRARVPKGQTFDRNAQTGPRLADEVDNP
ncbi:hypothetical protein DSM112329_02491 [Paraconexibacter sp. AEG42_29]|uniref:Mce/MlaD domain-containing protein n=1 Tax=Paraconexibacter sp. AEG42_29 TaxID=2997339 RepID=A0AAU7AVI0_9ACTN